MLMLSVELNTLLIILKRNLPSYYTTLNQMVTVSFYITWIIQRLLMFPILTFVFYYEWRRLSNERGTLYNYSLAGPIFSALFSILNFKWSYDKIIRIQAKQRQRLAEKREQ